LIHSLGILNVKMVIISSENENSHAVLSSCTRGKTEI
jgi:hypothetical protein